MGSVSLKDALSVSTCSICGKKRWFKKFPIKDNGWCCWECFEKSELPYSVRLLEISAEDIKERIESNQNPDSDNPTKVLESSKRKKKRLSIKSIIWISVSSFVLIYALAIVLALSFGERASDFTYHKKNVEVVESIVDSTDLAKDIVFAFEDTGAFEKNTKIDAEDIIQCAENEYELYAGLCVRLTLDDGFIVETFEQYYNEETAIVLYDSNLDGIVKALSSEERDELHKSQRKYIVENTIEITPSVGVLTHNALGTTKFSLQIRNTGKDKIDNVYLRFVPGFPGYEADSKALTYSTYESIMPGRSETYDLQTTKWFDYDYFRIVEVVVYFSDGTAIKFNRYDCQFL